MRIGCIGWGSLIWDPRDLQVASAWSSDGPRLPVEFARQADNGRITLVLVPETEHRVTTLWAELNHKDLEAAIQNIGRREGIPPEKWSSMIGVWSPEHTSPDDVSRSVCEWARPKGFNAVVWTALPPGLANQVGRVPSGTEVIEYLASTSGNTRALCEEYIRKAPKQTDTPYRRAIEQALGWGPFSSWFGQTSDVGRHIVTRSAKDPYVGALLGLACGDALGAPVEFLDKAQVEQQHGRLTEMIGGGGGNWEPGEWTDDTGMALAVAEGILEHPADPVAGVGSRFLTWQETAKDVGTTISAALGNARVQLGASEQIDWAEAGRTTPQVATGKAAGNGSLMRTLPVVLSYAEPGLMLTMSGRISAMTHWDPQAEVCCALYCLWVREILFGVEPQAAWEIAHELAREAAQEGQRSPDTPGPSPVPEAFWDRLEKAPDLRQDEIQPTGYAGYSVHCLEAAVWAVMNFGSLDEALIELVNLGGETDTMAAVAGGALGARYGLEAIPDRWLEVLHQRERLETAAQDLFELRHRLVYDRPLPEFQTRELDGGLLYGRNPLTAKDVELLSAAGVNTVLDLREDHEWTRPNRYGREAIAASDWCGIKRESVAIVDGDAPSVDQLDLTWRVLSEGLAEGSVYVHCRAGIERTGAVIVAYQARRDGLSLDETLERLNQSNAQLYPLPHQVQVVRQWLESVAGS
jgi:ADP-ribosyl-[dinitrogen reductase] hydrolase